MIVFKFDVAAALESAGVTSYMAVKNGLLSVDTWRKIKKNDANISMKTLNKICVILNMKPEHLITYKLDESEDSAIIKRLENL